MLYGAAEVTQRYHFNDYIKATGYAFRGHGLFLVAMKEYIKARSFISDPVKYFYFTKLPHFTTPETQRNQLNYCNQWSLSMERLDNMTNLGMMHEVTSC